MRRRLLHEPAVILQHVQLFLRESGVEEAQGYILRTRAGKIDLAERIARVYQTLKGDVPDPADVTAVRFGRMEKFEINGTDVRMILIKNPAGCNQVLSFLTQRTEPFVFAACLNDRTQDGRDVSWIWDVDFERLTAMEKVLSDIYVSGVRLDLEMYGSFHTFADRMEALHSF